MTDDVEVLYNADCPVCRFEINRYQDQSRRHACAITFDDLNDDQALSRWGLSEDAAARRLYLRQGERLLSGVPAFIALWRSLPGYGWLARLVSLPGIYHLGCWAYDRVVAPVIYKRHLRRREKSRS